MKSWLEKNDIEDIECIQRIMKQKLVLLKDLLEP